MKYSSIFYAPGLAKATMGMNDRAAMRNEVPLRNVDRIEAAADETPHTGIEHFAACAGRAFSPNADRHTGMANQFSDDRAAHGD